jgi:FAD/FMN-containing dehydrogenase
MRTALLVALVAISGCECATPAAKPKAIDPVQTSPDDVKVKAGVVVDDSSHLNATLVARVERPTTREELVAAVRGAGDKPVSLSGARHSQGGHGFVPDGVMIDMRGFNTIHEVDAAKKIVRVDSGVTWDQLQPALNDKGLALKTQQSSNIFTVGGSMSSNIHGRDPGATLLAGVVEGFRLLKPDGSVVNVSRAENAELFRLVNGGYGMFGVILDVDLKVTDNAVLEKRAQLMDYAAFPKFFEDTLSKPETALFIARPSVAPSSLLKETAVTWWAYTGKPMTDELRPLLGEKNVKRDKAVFDASRASDAGKEARWALQKKLIARPGKTELVSRNNAMRPPTAPLKFLEHFSDDDADIVQEYYLPKAQFVPFLDGAREVLQRRKVNLLGLTIRYVEADTETFLPYAREPSFSFMFYTNQKRDPAGLKAAHAMTSDLVELALKLGGRHYLSYQTWPSREQVVRGYPELDAWCAKKRELDPKGRFSSRFFRTYCVE